MTLFIESDPTKVGEADTASHLMQLVHVSRWNLSHVRVRVRAVRAASSHDAAESR